MASLGVKVLDKQIRAPQSEAQIRYAHHVAQPPSSPDVSGPFAYGKDQYDHLAEVTNLKIIHATSTALNCNVWSFDQVISELKIW